MATEHELVSPSPQSRVTNAHTVTTATITHDKAKSMTPTKRHYYFSLHINQQEYLRYYQGSASSVQVTSECGKRLKLPANRMRPFMTQNGISGRFRLTIDANNRFLDLQQL